MPLQRIKKWTLINNYGDKTLMRNKVAYEMSREAGMPFTPYCTFVDVIYNGEYEGAYQLCDQVEVNPGRVETHRDAPHRYKRRRSYRRVLHRDRCICQPGGIMVHIRQRDTRYDKIAQGR